MDIWFFYSIFGIKMIHLWLLAALADVFLGFLQLSMKAESVGKSKLWILYPAGG